jgi:hypothetical protein
VSRELAELIGPISAQTQTQFGVGRRRDARHAGHLEDHRGNDEGTKQTNVSIGQLTKLARGTTKLRRRLQGLGRLRGRGVSQGPARILLDLS